MAGQFDGKVAFITGAARGQGRSHAVRFAEEGADIIAIDICQQLDSVAYPLASREDLDETVNLVEKTGRRIIAEQSDVRDFAGLQAVLDTAVAELGRLDFVLANAGLAPGAGLPQPSMSAYVDAIDVMLNGVYFTIEAALPALLDRDDGGAIVITSSAAGLKSIGRSFDTREHGLAGYTAAKHGVVGLMRYFATILAEKNIRVNSVHPTGVATPMIQNDAVEGYAREHPSFAAAFQNMLPVDVIEPKDVSEAMIYLCSEAGRYVTGVTLALDAGILLK
ncbi:mycofactocin-coupled SDR family oxidoreductase [Mycobacterium sherrisii]|uniref:3-ketoacyl-ACP reductase n=1 Tax=Mycobacterium sherrisii TaxID=243061 RepID=A0A1E3SCL8_9MYCO|nr:mycofactocin-coupled SDR family oxidoreductase [Mycobacterium sherrisii]MCV7031961.1 mycofactocin-coupled SDR family oxidoreductase [Mycobacterium sherrisii]ODQ99821.1 3-ketoacyl-ACP reductase [Mycobacterium sherrisii]ORW76772.1 3-ketoacyl-ACP reductase [Mycobacterium sherrisii]